MLKGVIDGTLGLKCRLECCLDCAPLLEPDGLGLGTAQDMVVCLWTKTTLWTGEGLDWPPKMENGMSGPESILVLE